MPFDALPSPLDAVDDLRAAARWMIAAAGAAAGAVAFFWVTGQQGTTYVPVLTPQITAVPSAHHT